MTSSALERKFTNSYLAGAIREPLFRKTNVIPKAYSQAIEKKLFSFHMIVFMTSLLHKYFSKQTFPIGWPL